MVLTQRRSTPAITPEGNPRPTRAPLRVAPAVSDAGYDDPAGAGPGPSGARSRRTPAAVSAESALVRVGYTAVAGSMLVSVADARMVGFPLFSLLAAVLYVGYVVVYWSAIGTRRLEAGALGVASVGLALLYLSASV